MNKLLVNDPYGMQVVIEVGQGGGYYDDTRVIWDERVDGPLPTITLGGMVRNGLNLAFNQAQMDSQVPGLKKIKLELVSEIADAKIKGGTVINGLLISTDEDGRSLLAGAKQGGKPTRKVVTATGRAELTKLEFDAVVLAVDDFIQSVFDRQFDLGTLIDAAANKTQLDAIDIETGWPA